MNFARKRRIHDFSIVYRYSGVDFLVNPSPFPLQHALPSPSPHCLPLHYNSRTERLSFLHSHAGFRMIDMDEWPTTRRERA